MCQVGSVTQPGHLITSKYGWTLRSSLLWQYCTVEPLSVLWMISEGYQLAIAILDPSVSSRGCKRQPVWLHTACRHYFSFTF